ncbi:hypothetical protein ACMV_26530 [Acidiphilium multivorum AIU301]|uniref:Uncharacterized protein n=1 Tax=Acidiphilium multivorum (strain DSM 11245 / JCM 8867 / NBRC 100883 / AIU 301) TaxID=926570 RepID=F0J354_ACIMA|nr:DUF2840 domain-containing protein [Acidiphilium multivorum]BAJ82000.1 hypothetical protein ACMV_26530 [Acidiphilium multivorum AIU301]GAN73979.1 hypothetical protein Apmu_0130_04 [Acidiphilium multivorum AIU301]
MSQHEPLNSVMLVLIRRCVEHWLRFGHDVREQILDRRRRLNWFALGAEFASFRWWLNDFGTVVSLVDILRACTPAEPCSTVSGVDSGGEILLRQSGWSRVQHVFATIGVIETVGFDPADIAPHYWRHAHNRPTCDAAPRPYQDDQHRAWQRCRRMGVS